MMSENERMDLLKRPRQDSNDEEVLCQRCDYLTTERVACSDCKLNFCLRCANISASLWQCITKGEIENFIWSCRSCRATFPSQGKVHSWIKEFLTGRSQKVVIEGKLELKVSKPYKRNSAGKCVRPVIILGIYK